ncbi:MAG: glycosyltransferase family 9 protein, partial [Candidatus Omnitrophica bacterium]|nr:glycosyltransferase family 9 protein [Candidatus Omnitrophota bacterium]
LVRQLACRDYRKIVISGAKKDVSLAADISEGLGEKVAIMAGETTLKQLMALMARADIVISADSGPLHLANSVGTKTIALFGPTRPEITGPCGKAEVRILQHDVGCNRQACYYLECPDNVCMQAITVNEVERAVKLLE